MFSLYFLAFASVQETHHSYAYSLHSSSSLNLIHKFLLIFLYPPSIQMFLRYHFFLWFILSCLYILNTYNVICQLCLNTAGRETGPGSSLLVGVTRTRGGPGKCLDILSTSWWYLMPLNLWHLMSCLHDLPHFKLTFWVRHKPPPLEDSRMVERELDCESPWGQSLPHSRPTCNLRELTSLSRMCFPCH